MDDKDIRYLGIISLILFVCIVILNGMAILQYYRGYDAAMEEMEVKKEVEYEYGPWRLPRIRIEE